jgi:drug/metabolite transporter (DMT)-like permease
LVPMVGLMGGAWFLNETVGWADIAALALILVAIAIVLLPARRRQAA